jgi:hypothetical protein
LLNLPLETRRNGVCAVGGFLVVAVLAGCAGGPAREASPEEVVKQRSEQRWAAMVAGDLTKAYSYMSPASRESISPELFRNSIRVGFWKAAQVDNVACEADACEVTVQVTYVFRGSTVRSPLRETWVRSEGNWWHVFKPT